jgi:hypothetical protein
MGKRRNSKGEEDKSKSRRKGEGECRAFIDLSDLARCRHLSLAWFVRMAVAWLIKKDPIEDSIVDDINDVLDKAKREIETLKLSDKQKNEIILNLQDSEYDNLGVNEHFMKWESKEYARVFGGRGDRVQNFLCARKYLIGLSMLGKEITKLDNNVYLLMEPHPYLRLFSLSLAGFHEFYNRIRGFVAEYERERANREKKERVSTTAFLATLAGLVITELRKNRVHTCMIREVIGIPCKGSQIDIESKKEGVVGGNVFAFYIVSKNEFIPLDLTSLVRGILRLEALFRVNLSRTLASLADEFARHRRGGVDAMNLVGDTVFRYSVTGDLGYVYNMIRTVITSESYADLRNLMFGDGDEGGY